MTWTEQLARWWSEPALRVGAALVVGWFVLGRVNKRFSFRKRAQMNFGRTQRMFSPQQRRRVIRRDGRRCAYCKTRKGLQVDHVIPWSHGGPTDLWNAQMLCGADSGSGVNCNVSVKSDRREDQARFRFREIHGRPPRTGMMPPRRVLRRWGRFYSTPPGGRVEGSVRRPVGSSR